MRHVGIDYGTKRIGVAVSDEMGRVAFPVGTVAAGRGALAKVAEIVRENAAQRIVIGESLDFKNEPNAVQEDIEQFKKDLAELAGVPCEYEREFFTSALAERSGGDDSSAAALILQSYLDRMNNHGPHIH